MAYAMISDGRLYVWDEKGQMQEIESQFVAQKADIAERSKKYGGWKSNASVEEMYFIKNALWGQQTGAGPSGGYRFKSVILADDDTLFYVLTNNHVTGLFRYDLPDKFETRLFHRNELVECGIDYNPARKEFVMAVFDEDRRANLQLLNSSGSVIRELTTGDSRDSNPAFSLADRNQILFQSAGIARGEMGEVILHGPEAIWRFDLKSEVMKEVLSDDKYDFLLPKEDAKGNLYFIRRPYQTVGHNSIGRLILNFVLFPFHFAVAVIGFLDAFTKLFNQQSRMNPHINTPNQEKYVNVLGKTINLAKKQRSLFDKELSLVPGNWELVRMSPNGAFEVLARNVVSYDIDAASQVHYTNGYCVNRMTTDEKKTVFRHRVIEQLRTSAGSGPAVKEL